MECPCDECLVKVTCRGRYLSSEKENEIGNEVYGRIDELEKELENKYNVDITICDDGIEVEVDYEIQKKCPYYSEWRKEIEKEEEENKKIRQRIMDSNLPEVPPSKKQIDRIFPGLKLPDSESGINEFIKSIIKK